MKLNWVERCVVNNPVRAIIQNKIIGWMKRTRPLHPGAVVLEVGCGRGVGADLVFKEFEPMVVHALDLDHRMIRQAKRHTLRRMNKKISFTIGDVEHLPYEDAGLDAVFGFGILHHLINWRLGLSEISRVLKPGGAFFFEEFYPPCYLNPLVKHLLDHPEEDRFFSHDLKGALVHARLSLKDFFENEKLGILGVAIKETF